MCYKICGVQDDCLAYSVKWWCVQGTLALVVSRGNLKHRVLGTHSPSDTAA